MTTRRRVLLMGCGLLLVCFYRCASGSHADSISARQYTFTVVPPAGDIEQGFFFEVRTTKDYSCVDARLELDVQRLHDTLAVLLGEVTVPDSCTEGKGVATGWIFIDSLRQGEYVLQIVDSTVSDIYRLHIGGSEVDVSPRSGVFTAVAETESVAGHADTTAAAIQSGIRVFIDCPAGCYEDFIKTELDLIDYVRDKEVANLHLLITSQPAGNGGYEHTLLLIGLREFAGMLDTLRFFSGASDTDDMLQEKLLKILTLGLTRYAAKTALADYTEVRFVGRQSLTQVVDDPWNNWVFSTDHNVELTGQKLTSAAKLYSSFSANRVTDDWKIQMGFEFSYAEDKYTIDDVEYLSIARGYGLRSLIVASLGEHWSAGGFASLTSSTYDNTQMWLSIAPALEYNFLPYSESTRREARLLYRLGMNWFEYFDETIFYKTEEHLPAHSLLLSLDLKEPWGTATVSLEGSQYLHDLTKNRLIFSGGLTLRVWEGFSILAYGSASMVHDQLSLPAFGATPAEILLQRRELATTYSYYTGIGISYMFGSIYSNIVNPRFGR